MPKLDWTEIDADMELLRVAVVQTAAERARDRYTAHRATLDVPEWVPEWESLTVQQQRFVIEHLRDGEVFP